MITFYYLIGVWVLLFDDMGNFFFTCLCFLYEFFGLVLGALVLIFTFMLNVKGLLCCYVTCVSHYRFLFSLCSLTMLFYDTG